MEDISLPLCPKPLKRRASEGPPLQHSGSPRSSSPRRGRPSFRCFPFWPEWSGMQTGTRTSREAAPQGSGCPALISSC